MTNFVCFDFETNGVDANTCEVAQTSLASAPSDKRGWPDMSAVSCAEIYSCISHMPAEAAEVNGLSYEQRRKHAR